MSDIATGDLLEAQAAWTKPPERPWKLFVLALGWLIATVCGSLGGGLLAGIVTGRLIGGQLIEERGFLVGSTAGLQLMLVWASLRRARRIGADNRAAGLGWKTVTRHWLIPVLGVILIVNIAALLLFLAYTGIHLPEIRGGTQMLLEHFAELGLPTQVAMVFFLVVGAPVSEDLFFRGWLWTGLRQWWGPLPVMLCTSAIWLAAHLMDGLARPLFLIPAAIVLSLARYYCDSLKASMLLHMVNNLLAVGLLMLALSQG